MESIFSETIKSNPLPGEKMAFYFQQEIKKLRLWGISLKTANAVNCEVMTVFHKTSVQVTENVVML